MPGSGLRWGVAGYGDIVRRRALPALLSLSETVTCVWGRDGARARALCAEHRLPLGTDDYSLLLASADVVYIATPVAAHVPLALEALRAGRPVLVEKPLGLPAETVDPLLRAGPRVGVAYYRRLSPALAMVRDLLRGRVVHSVLMRCRTEFDPAPGDPRDWRTDPAVAGGGVLADVGSHRLDLLYWFLGEPAEFGATLGRRFTRGAERAARVHLAWRSGARADVDVEWAAGPPCDRLSIEFDGGRLEIDPLDSGRIRGVVDGVDLAESLPPAANPHASLIADFARSVLEDIAPVCPVEDAAAVDRIIAAAYASAASSSEEH